MPVSPPDRPRQSSAPYHHGDLRRALIDAAIALLTSGPPQALSLRRIAREVGVSHTAPYRHFANKQELLVAIAQTGFERLGQALQGPQLTHSTDPVEAFEHSSQNYVRFALENPSLYRLMFDATLDKQAHVALAATALGCIHQLVELLGRCRDDAGWSGGDPADQALVVWATLHGQASLLLDGQLGELDTEAGLELTRRCLQSLRDGLR